MADQINTRAEHSGSTSRSMPGAENFGNGAQSAADQARGAARDLKDRASDIAGASSEAIQRQGSEFVDAAKEMAAQTGDKIKQSVDGQKAAGAEYVSTLADTIRRAAHEFDNDLPIAATYIRKAASQVESVSDSIRNGNLNDLLRGAQSFARRQPTAFLGIAVLAGFGVVRFLKSSSESAGPTSSQAYANDDHHSSDNRGYRDEFTS
jgi:ElaB/YqjD/DUF883 family membrane-anchored ribosome-binding protein